MREGERGEVRGVPHHFAGEAASRLLGEGRRLGVEVHEDEVAEHLHLDGGEGDRGGVEDLDALGVPGPVEAPVERIHPPVVGARDVPLSPAAPRQHLVPPMLADVVEGPKRPVRPAHRDDTQILHPCRHVAPRLTQLLLVAKELPAPPKDLGPLHLEEPRIDIAVRPDRRRPRRDRVVPLPGTRKLLPRQPLRHEPSPPVRVPRTGYSNIRLTLHEFHYSVHRYGNSYQRMIMAELPEALPVVELTTDEVERLSSRLQEETKGAKRSQGKQQRWILIGAESRREAAVIRTTATMARRIVGQRRKELTERNVEALVDLYLEGEKRADVDGELEQDNAELRARYLLEVPTWTAAEIHELMHGSQLRNPSEPASRWRREKRVFAVRGGRAQLFPRFQFADGNPLPVIKEVLKRLPDDMTPWQIAFWFRSGNGWLDGKSPEEALGDEDGVLNAADRLREPAIG